MANGKVSFTYTALIWTGIVLCLSGFVIAVLGLGGLTSFEASFDSIKVKTTSVGLAIVVVGAVLSGTVAIKLPRGVRVMALEEPDTFTVVLARRIPSISLVVGIVAIVCLVLSLVVVGH